MPILETDIKLLKSARMTDTPDGGGRMTGNVVQSGADNNLFDDVSSLDRVHGNVSLRKMFAAVLTTDTDKYLGARVIIDRPAADAHIESTLFAASSLFDTRDAAKQRVEAYLAQGSPTSALLYGPHLTGMLSLTLVQRIEEALPTTGQTLVLQKDAGLPTETTQYVRITSATQVAQTFTDAEGEFVRSVVSATISDPLRYDFTGFEAARTSPADFVGKTRVFDTVVANAANYFGIRPLSADATLGAMAVKADSAYSQLLPSSQIETPILDATAAGTSTALLAAGATVVVPVTIATPAASVFVGGGMLPGTVAIDIAGVATVSDDAGTLRYGGVDVGTVDYENGVLTFSAAPTSGPGTVSYAPAVAAEMVTASTGFDVTAENRSLTFVATLPNTPTKTSLTFSYMAEGRWYVLRENGMGVLRGASAGFGAGILNYATNGVAVTMGALPDVGSALIIQWVEATRVGSAADAPSLQLGGRFFAPLATGKSLTATNVSVLWAEGAANRTAVDDGVGNLSGDATGTVDYSTGTILWSPNALPAKNAVVTVNGDKHVSKTANLSGTASGGLLSLAAGEPVQPRSFSVTLNVSVYPGGALTAIGGALASGESLHDVRSMSELVVVYDNGVGGLLFKCTAQPGWVGAAGTINYGTGQVNIDLSSAPAPPGGFGGFVYIGRTTASYHYTQFSREVRVTAASPTLSIYYPNSYLSLTYPAVYATGASSATPFTTPVSDFFAAVDFVPEGAALSKVRFSVGVDRFASTSTGDLVKNPSTSSGLGAVVGAVDGPLGVLTMGTWTTGMSSEIGGFAAVFAPPTSGVPGTWDNSFVMFRTASVPLRPGSLQIIGKMSDGADINITAGADGKINASRIKGTVNYDTGVITLIACNPSATEAGTLDVTGLGIPGVTTVNADALRTETLRYNAVAYSYLPLDADILGLDPVRLPSDGRVPVFKAGRVVVVHNTQSLAAQAVSNGQTVSCGRTLLSRIRVMGADGLEITSGFAKNLDAGTVTFTNTAGMSQPVAIEHRVEDEALCVDSQITGDLRLSRPLTHAYPANTSYVSSAYVAGTLQAAAQDSFSQETWTAAWSDSRIGNPVLAQYDDTANPLVVTNAGAITERWAIIFQSNTAFNLVGEEVGQIITGDTATPLAPVNPATGVPYFTLQPAGWGLGWAAGNVLRFNTSGANFPLWVARTVRQSPAAPPGSDQINISVRGDIDQ